MSDRSPRSGRSGRSRRSGGSGRSAVVLGGGLAGVLTAQALSGLADVTVVERDELPTGPAARKGLPQARHVHLLWSGGAEAVEELLPGTINRLMARGAHRLALPDDMIGFSPQGWLRRWAGEHYMLLSSRDLLDATLRAEVLASERVTLRQHTEVLGLTGDGSAVAGVRVRDREGVQSTLRADLVVDTTGRSSRAAGWLRSLGLPPVPERTVSSGLVYASRLYRAPEAAHGGFPAVNIQADPRGPGPGRAGTLVLIEDGRWHVTLSGTTGGAPSGRNDAFEPFARGLRHPVLADLIADAEPLDDVVLTRATANRRHYYERARHWPDGFAVLGDAVAAYNPIYGHGMSVAAQSARALRAVLRRRGWGTPGLARHIQRAIAGPVAVAWDLATGQDVFYPGATPNGPTLRERATAAYVDRLMHTATGNGRIARELTRVTSMEDGPLLLLKPSVLLAAVRGPLRPPLGGPPLTPAERGAVR
ncbi:FAD-dependent monooxygenase [Streptomyces sp. NPDC059578]|uniref:FAD-dependent monooxygenase n=1 Tax=Streptomyces sp. NPDC059578 TaxID=3346874 RepID=UPI0036A1973F